jgi:hypothetical protein
LQTKTKIVSSLTTDSKQAKQEVNGTVILPPLVFPGLLDNFKSNLRTSEYLNIWKKIPLKKLKKNCGREWV